MWSWNFQILFFFCRRADWGILQSLGKSWLRSAADSCIYISLCYNCPSPQPNRNPKTEQRIETNLNISDFGSLIFFICTVEVFDGQGTRNMLGQACGFLNRV